jgi:PAS domain S-box-containing protein
MAAIFRKYTIKQKLLIFSSIIIFILVGYFYFYFTYITELQFREGLLKKGTGLVQTLSFNLGPGLFFHQTDYIHRVLQGIQNDPDMSFLYVMDESNSRIYGFRDEKYDDLIKSITSSNEVHDFIGDHLIIKQSIFYNDEYQGSLIAGFNLNWVNAKISDQRRQIVLITLVLIVVLVVLTSLISNAIAKPINEVISRINQLTLERFNPEVRLPEKGDDEIKQLSVAFNYLSDSLGKNLEELKQSHKYIEAFFRQSPLPILISDSLGNIENANESAARYFKMKLNELINQNLGVFFNPLDFNSMVSKLDQNKSEVSGYITTIKSADEVNRVVEINLSALSSQQDDEERYIIAIIDITEKISTQREILENQTKLHRVNWELVQKTYELETAMSKNKRNARKLANLIEISGTLIRLKSPAEVFNILLNAGSELLEADQCVIFLWNTNKNHLIPSKANPNKLLSRLKPIKIGTGIVSRTFAENQPYFLDGESLQRFDFEELKLASNQKLSLISVPLSEKDYKFGVAVYLKHKKNTFYLEDLHLITTLSHQAAITLDKIYLLQALKEKAQHLQSAYSDLTKSQEQVLQLQKMESLGTLVGGIAHDFNNILGIITPNLDLLRMAAQNFPEILKRVSIVDEAAGRAADLTRQLLVFSRNQDMKLEPISLKEMILRMTDMLKPTLGKNIEIKTEINQEVPLINADETRISQVIVNLALNSRDAMPDGGILTIGLSSGADVPENTEKTDSDYICLYLKDTGRGIPKENISKIFDPFFTTKGVGNGTGLGLSIVYGIVKSHNGFIRVESEVGKGTSFYIYFEISDKPLQVHEQIEIDYYPTGNENILVVDDEDMIRESISDILSALGYNTITAESGKEAVEIIGKHRRIHLAVVDYIMPKMNGIETIKRLKRINPNIKILLSTGHTDREKLKEKSPIIDGILLKPYHISDLSKKIKDILGKEVEEKIS